MSFTSAALSALRANEPQLASSASVPRHTYSSSYARDYADLQAYQDYLSSHKRDQDESASKKKEAYSQRATNNDPRNNYNILSHARDPRGDYNDGRSSAAGTATPSSRPHQPIRAPYAQEEYENDGGARESSRREDGGRASSNPSRYVSNSAASYGAPDSSRVSGGLPLPPSKQQMPTSSSSRSRDENHSPAPAARSHASAAVPALALGRITKAAFEPYTSNDQEPELTRTAASRENDGDARDRERDYDRDYDEPQYERARQPEYERERSYDREYDRDYDDRSYDRDRAEFRASPDERGASEFGRRQELHARQESSSSYDRPSRDRHYDDEDQVSQPMADLRVQPPARRQYDEYDDYVDRVRDRDYDQPRASGGGNDGDRYRKQYQDGDDAYGTPRSSRDQYQQQASVAPFASRGGAGGRSSRPSPSYADLPAGRASGLASDAQRNRAHTNIFGVRAEDVETERPRKKLVPGYEQYVERSSRQPRKSVGPPARDPDAAGGRVTRQAERYGHLDSGFTIGVHPVSASEAAESSRSITGGSHTGRHPQPSIYVRNPILQDSPEFAARPAGSSSSRGGGSGIDHDGRAGRSQEAWSSDVAPRPVVGMHASYESAEVERMKFGRTDLQPTKVDPLHASGDRGLRMVPGASYAHHDIFHTMANEHARARPKQGPVGLKVTQDRNASHDVLASHNLRYDARDSDWSSEPSRSTMDDHERDARTSAASSSQERGYLQSSVSSGFKTREPFSPQNKSLAYNSASNAAAASRLPHRTDEQRAERERYENELRRLHKEQRDVSARGVQAKARGQGYESTRLW